MSENENKNKYEIGDIIFDVTKLNKMLTRKEAKTGTIIIPEYDKDGVKSPDRYAELTIIPLKVNNEEYYIEPFDICILDTIYSMIQNDVKSFSIGELANRLVKRELKFEHTRMQLPAQFLEAFNIPAFSHVNNPEIPVEKLNFFNHLLFSINKLSCINVTIDCTHLNGPRDIDPNSEKVQYKKNILFGRLLPIKGQIFQTAGMPEEKLRYTMSETPVLFDYAISYRRVARGPAKLMASPLRATPENITLQNAVARRIVQIKNKNNHSASNRISYEWGKNGEKGLLSRVGIRRENFSSDNAWSQKKTKVHKAVGKILEKYKEDNIIKDYHEVKDGKIYIGYDIDI